MFLIRDVVLLSCVFCMLDLLYMSLIGSHHHHCGGLLESLCIPPLGYRAVCHYNAMCPSLFLMESLHERTFNCVPDSRYCAAFMQVFVYLTYCTCH